MKALTKVAIVSASILSMGALTACQTTTAPQQAKDSKKHHHNMSPEMREKHQAHKAERKAISEKIQKACDGKTVGQAVQVKVGEKTVDGSCVIQFKADRKEMKKDRGEFRGMRGEHRPMRGDLQSKNFKQGDFKRGEVLTDEKRAELTKQYQERLASRQAQQQAFLKACEGQTHGKAVQIKLGEKAINGQCHVRFQPNKVQTTQTTKAA